MNTSSGKDCNPNCGCQSRLSRRTFVKATGAGALAVLAAQLDAMAGPFDQADFEKFVPADKKLSQAWIQSLFDRGEPLYYEGKALKYIGMPVGGLCAGQLYLGGDGSLWHWDIFNQPISTGADHYAHPMEPASPLDQGFTLQIGDKTYALNRSGFSKVRFRGEYPIGMVEYQDAACPVAVTLEAFSPFIPLNVDDSSLPATILQFSIQNTSTETVGVALSGRLENAVCLSGRGLNGLRRNRILQAPGLTFLDCSAEEKEQPKTEPRQDILFEDWSAKKYHGWTTEGVAFGEGPIKKSDIPEYQGDVGGDAPQVVNSHATAPGKEVGEKDAQTGKLTSKPFEIARRFIQCWIGGGNHSGKTCLNLLVDGDIVQTATGRADNKMAVEYFDVSGLEGRTAVIEIVDAETGGWGNIGVGRITFTDQFPQTGPLEDQPDYGTMGLGILGAPAEITSEDATSSLHEKLTGNLGRKATIAPGESTCVTFLLTWHFPNLKMDKLPGGRFYAQRFPSAAAVAEYVAANFDRLASETKCWRDTWYDATLPYWFLDRTFLNTSILASSTCHRFKDGRFYAWEGVGCCAGTCGHVWHYAHAPARIFPELERDTRERVDFGLALQPDGAIRFRAEFNDIPAVDGQAGAILRAYREHQMSADSTFLQRNWAGIKRATEWLIAKDADNDGIIEDNQHNTLDTDWYGPVAWLSGLYLAALRAAEEMARETGDAEFAGRCREIFDKGRENLVAKLFEGEYFINKPDPKHAEAINSGSGCEIDQVMGQSWAWQTGLGRVLPETETKSALQALWRYNFTPDVGPYREEHQPGRWYAMPGEAGLLMCTFPRADWNYDKAKGEGAEWAAGYFNECMNGFEYQAAGHMIWEGMVQEGLAVTRAVHDRYDALRRNPWNEIECGDHYARSMASYGVFLAICGFEYHGPKGHIGFAPRLSPNDFKAPFTSASGWGTFQQKRDATGCAASISVKYGTLNVQTVALASPAEPTRVKVTIDGSEIAHRAEFQSDRVLIALVMPVSLLKDQKMNVLMA